MVAVSMIVAGVGLIFITLHWGAVGKPVLLWLLAAALIAGGAAMLPRRSDGKVALSASDVEVFRALAQM